jgi:hypothetical protein
VGRSSRWLVFLPVAFLALLPSQANAEPEPGLNAVGYLIDEIPPERSDTIYPTCGSEVENNINRNFNGEPFQDCGWDFFMVHYSGFINLPEHETIEFMVAADDGGTVSIDGNEFGTWNLKGCAWSSTITLSVIPGAYPLDGWFFEAGGGTCYMLAWKIDDNYWEIVPEWAFTTASTPTTTTTTTTVPLETVPVTDPTTTTLQETSTTTTQETTTTTLPETTTTSTLPPSTSTTQAWVPPPTSTTSEPSTTVVETTTTTELPPQPTTTLVVQTSTSSSVVKTTTTTAASTTTSEPVVTTTSPEVTASTTQQVVQELPEPPQPNEPVSQAQAMSIALNPQVLATVSSDQAEAVFEALSVSELTNTEVAALVEAVQEAPTEVRAAFEKEIDIFGEGLDDYVPLGSNIPVGTRRTLIAVTAGITLAAAGTRMRK